MLQQKETTTKAKTGLHELAKVKVSGTCAMGPQAVCSRKYSCHGPLKKAICSRYVLLQMWGYSPKIYPHFSIWQLQLLLPNSHKMMIDKIPQQCKKCRETSNQSHLSGMTWVWPRKHPHAGHWQLLVKWTHMSNEFPAKPTEWSWHSYCSPRQNDNSNKLRFEADWGPEPTWCMRTFLCFLQLYIIHIYICVYRYICSASCNWKQRRSSYHVEIDKTTFLPPHAISDDFCNFQWFY